MSDEKWTIEKVREEIYQARTRMFVVSKVLETGSIKTQEHPEWVLVIKPLLKDLTEQVEKITALLDEETTPGNA
jgi:hypothetical protein